MQNETTFRNSKNIEKNRLFQDFVIMISPDYHTLLDKVEENFYLQTADSVAL